MESAATESGIVVDVTTVEHPVSYEVAFRVLDKSTTLSEEPILVLDISAMPREFASYLCDIVCGLCDPFYRIGFRELYVVQTPPERLTSRSGLGPFSVGTPACVYQKDLLYSRIDRLKTSALIFPGIEGFEARACVDLLRPFHSHTSVALNCFEPSFPAALDLMVGNQSIFFDAADKSIGLQYYYSDEDAVRVAFDAADRAVNLVKEFPEQRHAFLVAPFGPKWSVMVSTLARVHYVRRCRKIGHASRVTTDVLVMPRSQYVSLHSRGSLPSRVLRVQHEST